MQIELWENWTPVQNGKLYWVWYGVGTEKNRGAVDTSGNKWIPCLYKNGKFSGAFCGVQQLSSLTHAVIHNGVVILAFLCSKMNRWRLLFIFSHLRRHSWHMNTRTCCCLQIDTSNKLKSNLPLKFHWSDFVIWSSCEAGINKMITRGGA